MLHGMTEYVIFVIQLNWGINTIISLRVPTFESPISLQYLDADSELLRYLALDLIHLKA